MHEAQVGLYLMCIAVIGCALVDNLIELEKVSLSAKPWSMVIAIAIFYTGVVMCTPTVLSPGQFRWAYAWVVVTAGLIGYILAVRFWRFVFFVLSSIGGWCTKK
jgi:hypothetical protein